MKLKLTAILVLAVAGCTTTSPFEQWPKPLKAGDTTYEVLPEPVNAGVNIYLIKRNQGRPYLEWVDGEKIAEEFCQKRQEGKAEIFIGTYPDLMSFQCELGAHEKPTTFPRVFQRNSN